MSSRRSDDKKAREEQNPFLSPEEAADAQRIRATIRRQSSEVREQRFSLQDMEYPEATIPLDSHPLLDEFILSQPNTIQTKMGSALGLHSGKPTWLPSTAIEETNSEEEDDISQNARLEYPEIYRRSRILPIFPRRDSVQPLDRDLTHDIPMITLNTSNLRPSSLDHEIPNEFDLETGLNVPPETPMSREFPRDIYTNPAQTSPSKLSGFITRLTDRIVGTDHPQTPMKDKNTSSFWFNEHADVSSKRSSSAGFSQLDPDNVPDNISGNALASAPANVSSTSVMRQTSPYIGPGEQHYHSSMESIHSFSAPSDRGAQNLSITNSLRLPRVSIGSSVSTPETSSDGSDGFVPGLTNTTQNDIALSAQESYLHGKSLGIFSPESSFRKWCHKVVSHKLTMIAATVLIILQTALLGRRQWNPSVERGYYYYGYSAGDFVLIIINVFYTAEFLLKTISYGLYDDKVMFQDLGLPYPEKSSLFENNVFYSFLRRNFPGKMFRFITKKATSSKKPSSASQPAAFSIEQNQYATQMGGKFSAGSEIEANTGNTINSQMNTRSLVGHDVSLSVSRPPKEKMSRSHTFFNVNYLGNIFDESKIKRAVLRDNWQRIDLVAILSFWIATVMSWNYWDIRHQVMIFRALSCLRIMRLCKLTDGTNMILRACESCIPQLIDVGIFIACFWLIIGIVGVQSFKSSLSRHCVWTNPEDATEQYINSDRYCGSYIGLDGITYPYLNRAGNHVGKAKGFRCPMYSVCQSGENPYGGTVNFDNILQSMQMVFVMISVNTFSDIMYDLTDSDSLAAALFFIVGIFILTVWLMNIFIAIIVASFKSIQMEADEEEKRNSGGNNRTDFIKSLFSNDAHSSKVRELVLKKPFLKIYYRFEIVFILGIIASLITQAFRTSEMTEAKAHILYRIEAACTLLFLLEIILRFMLYVPDIKTFFLSRSNCFDLCLAIITSIIIIEPVKEKLGHAYYWLTFFQLARFYRVVLYTRITSGLWVKIFRNFKPIYDLTLFYFILLFVSSIIMARYFEGTVPPEDVDEVQFAMNTLPNALMSMYVITSTENWADIMYELQQYASNTFQRAVGSMLLVLWFIISNLIVMNIFIAVIATSLEMSAEGRKKYQVTHFIADMTKRLQTVKINPGWAHKLKSMAFKPNEEKNIEKAITNLLLSGRAVTEFLNGDGVEAETEHTDVNSGISQNGFTKWWLRKCQFFKKPFQNPFYSQKSMATDVKNFNPADFATRVITERRMLIEEQDAYLKANPNYNFVFYFLSPRHKIRKFCQMIVPSSFGERINGVEPNRVISEIFSVFMFLSTVALVVTACLQTPLYRIELVKDVGRWNWTFFIDTAFMSIFMLEFLVKVLADGFVFTPNAYARSPWNWLDFCALHSLWIEFIAYLKDDSSLSRIVRGLKALRALRILTISETAKNNFHYTMLSGFGKIMSAAIISLTLLLPFSVWGINIFNGRLGYCLDGSSSSAECLYEYQNSVFDWNIVSPNVYVQPYLHMDSFSSSFSSLYEIVSLEGWVDLLINVMQSTGIGTPQQMFASPINGLWVIFFNFVSTIFILTLFVSVIISNYSIVTGRAYLTPVQVQWYHVKKFLLQVKPSKRKEISSLHGIRKWCYEITVEKNKIWTMILNVVLVMHVFVLLIEAFPRIVSNEFRHACFMIASSCFLIHYIMLLIAQKLRLFVQNKWNLFSLSVALGAWSTTLVGYSVSSDSIYFNFNKIFLVALLIFLFPRSDRLNQLLKFASASFPSLFSLLFTWFVTFLMYAIAMNQIFGLTKVGPNTSGNINLRSVPKAFILLFRCSFGEGWNYIMDDFMIAEPFCVSTSSSGDSDCGSKEYAYVLFISWNVISMYIMLNLFVSLILDSFSYIEGGKQYSHLISRPEIRKFKRTWQKFDPEGTGFISPDDLPQLLHSLSGSLSFSFYSGELSIPELCARWITRNSSSNPYDIEVDYEEMNSVLQMMNYAKIKERRRVYEQFTEKALMNMELHEEPGISFSKLIVQIPLYNSFDAHECLIFIDYMESDLLEKKVIERLSKKRFYELVEGFVCRWMYLRWKRGEITKEEFLLRGTSSSSQSDI